MATRRSDRTSLSEAALPAKKKVTYYLGDDVVRATKIRAARTDRRDSEVVEEALRAHLGFDLLERVWQRSELTEKEALDFAVSEVHAMRRQRRGARRP